MKEYSKQEAYSRATALCSKSEKCVSDIRKKLFDWHVERVDHDGVINLLIDNKYINEERFALYFVRDKYRFNGWGRVKIRYQLSLKQIPSDFIEEAMNTIDDELYAEKLRHALEIKNRGITTGDQYERRQKLMRFAAGRGFSSDEIIRELDALL